LSVPLVSIEELEDIKGLIGFLRVLVVYRYASWCKALQRTAVSCRKINSYKSVNNLIVPNLARTKPLVRKLVG